MPSFSFDNADGEQESIIDNGGGYNNPSTAPAPLFDFTGLFDSLIGVAPDLVNSINGTTPDTIIYQQGQKDMDNYTPWLIGIGTILIIGIILYVTLKK